ncbi:hypothetical protein OPU38_03480, partial [Acinetobacter baumannii]|nr:hypothetical protein [Acinetobacter baumannii]
GRVAQNQAEQKEFVADTKADAQAKLNTAQPAHGVNAQTGVNVGVNVAGINANANVNAGAQASTQKGEKKSFIKGLFGTN